MPVVKTKGAASAQGFGEFAASSGAVTYIEDVFSTYLYTGNNSTLSITNGIDVSGKGGLVWIKNRQQAGYYHTLVDTVRGPSKQLYSNTTNAQSTATGLDVTAFTSTGFTLGPDNFCNQNNANNVSWTFRKQPKFFDVVTWTGTGSATTIAHNLGSTPGCIIVKAYAVSGYGWRVYHSYLGATQYLSLEVTSAATTSSTTWNNTAPTSTNFTVGTDVRVNEAGVNYIAYVFASNAGGFGLTGTDNVISCGSFTTDGSGNATVNLGYEPQWILVKPSSTSGNWLIYDTMRGWAQTSDLALYPNLSNAELQQWSSGLTWSPTATGFQSAGWWAASQTYIYIAIRRGPMKVPTSGTSVFAPVTRTGTGANATISGVGFAPDVLLSADRNSAPQKAAFYDKLRGVGTQGGGAALLTSSSTHEQNYTDALLSYTNTGVNVGAEASTVTINYSGEPFVTWFFQRAPNFFDEVCWTGTGSGSQAITHNLGVAPEFTITKRRSSGNWSCFPVMFGVNTGIYLDSTAALQTGAALHPTLPTATTYYTDDASWGVENIGGFFVTYLFATCAGVSKVGSYTGTGTTQQINCGFTGGARFVLIKRTDSTGDWYVWDSARGIVAGNDPYLLLNLTAAEVTNTDYVDTYSAGFEISSTAPAAINASGGTFIFLAIA